MLRNLLIIIIILSSVSATYAQKKNRKNKKKDNAIEVSDTVKIDYQAEGAPMPDIRAYTRKGEMLTTKDLDGKSNLIVMTFNPTCDHCQEQVYIFEKNIHLFDKTKILLMANNEMYSYLDFFNNVTRYSKYPSINVGVDSADYIKKTYTYTSLPQINVYDKKRKLIKVFHGETPIETLKPYID